jgi:gliding motility-associated-like protein
MDSVLVTVTTAPPLSVSNDTAMCAGGSAVLNAAGATSYSWSPGNQTGSSITVTPVSTTTYVVTGNNNNCISIDTIVVAITPPPAVYAGPDFSICRGTQAAMNVSTTGFSYSWSPATGIIGSTTQQNVIINPTTSTSYTVTVVGASGCISTDTIDVTVNATPTVTATATDNSICVGQNTTLSSSGALTYSWIPTVGVQNPNQVTTTANPANTTTYAVVGIDANGCADTSSVTITVNPLPNVYITSTPSECGDSTGTFDFGGVVAGTGPFTYTINSQQYNNLPVGGFPAGSYNITITDANGCVSTEQVNINMVNTASLNASANPSFGVYPLPVSFLSNGSGGLNNWVWNFGDGSPNSNLSNPANTYTTPGVYTVVVAAWNDDPACVVFDTLTIEVVEQATLAMTNVFTPNSDGTNDFFTAKISGVKEIKVEVFDRWGRLVHESTSSGLAASPQDVPLWDGKSGGGNLAADGTYYYIIHATGYDTKEYPMTGFVELIQGK